MLEKGEKKKNIWKSLRQEFPNRLIRSFDCWQRDIDWPPRSSDLPRRDFSLKGYLKGKEYANNSRIIHKLKANIPAVIIYFTFRRSKN